MVFTEKYIQKYHELFEVGAKVIYIYFINGLPYKYRCTNYMVLITFAIFSGLPRKLLKIYHEYIVAILLNVNNVVNISLSGKVVHRQPEERQQRLPQAENNFFYPIVFKPSHSHFHSTLIYSTSFIIALNRSINYFKHFA